MTGKQNVNGNLCECECSGHSWHLSIELSMKSATFSVKKKQKMQQKINACQCSIRPGKVDLLFTPALLHLRPAASQLLLPSKVAGKLHTHSVNLLQSLKVGVSSFG